MISESCLDLLEMDLEMVRRSGGIDFNNGIEIEYIDADLEFSHSLARDLQINNLYVFKHKAFGKKLRVLSHEESVPDLFRNMTSLGKVKIIVVSTKIFSRFQFMQHLQNDTHIPYREIIVIARDIKITPMLPKWLRSKRIFDFSNSGRYEQNLAMLLDHFSSLSNEKETVGLNDLPPEDVIPVPVGKAVRFIDNNLGKIDILPIEDVSEHLDSTISQSEDYSEIRYKALELIDLGSNRLGRLQRPLARLVELSENVANVRRNAFWSRANTLRIFLQDHEMCSANERVTIHDERVLEPIVASGLRDLVETINIFMIGDKGLLELDEVKPGPQEDTRDAERAESVKPVLTDILMRDSILTEDAKSVVQDQIDNMGIISDSLARRQSRGFAFRSIQNLMIALLRKSHSVARTILSKSKTEVANMIKGVREGVYRGAGNAIYVGIASEVIGFTNFTKNLLDLFKLYSSEFTNYFASIYNNPAITKIIKIVIDIF